MDFFIPFWTRETKFMKKHPLESSLEISNYQNYEKTNKHLLIRACKIHESVTYQVLFSLLFNLVKNEERLELSFLDSLKFSRKYNEELIALSYK